MEILLSAKGISKSFQGKKVLDDISFNATDRAGETVKIDEKYVNDNLGSLVRDTDLSKFIL